MAYIELVATTLSTDAKRVVKAQQRWAEAAGRPVNAAGSGLATRHDALFMDLPTDVAAQFEGAPGGELRKIHSFRSSSGLAVNVFLPWRSQPTPIAHLLGGGGSYDRLAFEAAHDTGISQPYLDVLISGGNVTIAVESKFVEPYDDHDRSVFSDKYFGRDGLWKPFPELKPIALRFSKADGCYERLDAAQLLKHAMGLINAYGRDGFELVYLWYEIEGSRASQHRKDISEFTALTADVFPMRAVTYQDLFRDIKRLDEPSDGYLAYLADRYFGGA